MLCSSLVASTVATTTNSVVADQMHSAARTFEELLAQDVEQNSPPEEQSTLVQAAACDMDSVQQAEHTRDQTWHRQEVEKRRRMAQPAWKTAMDAQQTLLASHQQRAMAGQPAF